MENRKKVLFFTHGGVGGAERVTLTIAKLLPREEFDVRIVFVGKDIKDIDKFVPDWMPQSLLKIRNIWDFTTLRLYRLIKRERPYAVFSSLLYLNIRVINAARFVPDVKKIIVRNDNVLSYYSPYLRSIARYCYPCATDIILQSEEMKNEFAGFLPELISKMKSIPNPLDLDTIKNKIGLSENPFSDSSCYVNYVYTGHIKQEKGIDVLLKAFRKVLDKEPNSRLTLVGAFKSSDSYYLSIIKLIEKLDLVSKVWFIGFTDNPYSYMQHADCFVLPSYIEGNPNVLHEAMWLKTPVVATRSIPIIEQIVTEERGFTVNPGDIDNLAESMIKASKMIVKRSYDYTGGQSEFVELFQ